MFPDTFVAGAAHLSRYVSIMTRVLLLVFTAIFASQASALDADALNTMEQKLCDRTSAEIDISNRVFLTGFYSDVLLKLLSGNTKEAAKQIGSELSLEVLILNAKLNRNPCKATEETLSRILPILRVVAAVNNKTPIPEINNNKDVLKVLEQAIQDNPKHYHEMIERSKEWDRGIK